MTEYDENWIETYTGKIFHYLDPHPDEVCIEDIAHALAMKCRFSGHCHQFYSVAEHTIRVAGIVPEEDILGALLHDAAEAYIPDIPRPIKIAFGLREAEDKILSIILMKYRTHLTEAILWADNVLLATEARDLMYKVDGGWGDLPDPLPDKIIPFKTPELAEAALYGFLAEATKG